MTLAYDTCKALRVCDTCHLTLTSRASAPPSTSFDSATGCASPASSPVAEANPSTSSHRTGLLEVALQPPPPPLLPPASSINLNPFGCFSSGRQVKVETVSVLSGYLLLKTRGKTWHKRWFALRSDFVLYSYRSHQGESRAMTATPVPGFTVSLLSGYAAPVSGSSCSSGLVDGASPSHKASVALASSGDASTERDRSFKMAHVHKSYLFQAATRQEAERLSIIILFISFENYFHHHPAILPTEWKLDSYYSLMAGCYRWVQFLQMAARADLPSPT